MIDEIKKRTILDVTPNDIANSYTDSTFNVGSPPLSTITGQDTATFTDSAIFHPGASGARTTPGDSGFAYADTPEATVFIQKRQWVEDDWTYVTNSKERPGKIQELLLRVRLGNIITRKLDWLNDHEIFTKVNQLTTELNRSALDLGGAQVTRYYTETLNLSEQVKVTEETKIDTVEEISIATAVVVNTQDSGEAGRLLIRSKPGSGEILTAIHGPFTTGTPGPVIVKTTVEGSNPSKIQNVVNGANSVDLTPEPKLDYPATAKTNPQILEQYPSAEWWEIDLASLNPQDFFPERNRDSILKLMPAEQRAKATMAEMQNFIFEAIKNGFNGGIGYVRRVPEGRTPPRQYAKSHGQPKLIPVVSGSTQGPPKVISDVTTPRILHNVFNGVIELANISSINTSINNAGNIGSAQLTLQNPNNNLLITEEDIDIAMGENPFLEGTRNEFGESPADITATDPITGETRNYKYYRGRYYTDRAYNLVTRQDLSAIGNFTNSEDQSKLTSFIQDLQFGIQTLQSFATSGKYDFFAQFFLDYKAPTNLPDIQAVTNAASKFEKIPANPNHVVAGVYLPFKTIEPEVRKKIQQFAHAILISQREIETLANAGNLKVKIQDNLQELLVRNSLKKFFQNRTIFQPLDRVFIWMSSPSRTEHTDKNGTPVSEDFTIGGQKAKKVQEIVSLLQQLENVIQTIASQLNQSIGLVFSAETLSIINQELYQTGNSEQLKKTLKNVKEAFKSQSAANALLETFIDAQNFVINPFGFQSTLSTTPAKLPPVMESIIKTIEDRVANLKILINSAPPTDKLPASTDTSVQGVDPSALFTNPTLGFTERQFQVFQGVITRISRNFSNGVFTVRLDCADNLYFLQRSRYTEVPGLLTYTTEALAELDDPIWRQKGAFISSTLSIAAKDVPTESFFGKWKVGQQTLTAQVRPSKEGVESTLEKGQSKESTNTSNVHSEETIGRAFGRRPQIENEPFDGADPATIISILTCGIPFDLLTYVSNTIFKGSLVVSPKLKNSPNTSHDGENLRVGPFESVRQQIAPLVRKYGDFQPYLFSEVPVTEEDRKNTDLATRMNLAISVMSFYKAFIAARKSVLSADIEKDKQKTDTPGSPFKAITAENVSQVIPDTGFPSSVEEINLASSFKGAIDKRVAFLITAAIRQVTSSKVNNIMKIQFSADNFKLGADDFSSAYQQTPDKTIFALGSEETAFYNSITQAAADRVTRGAVFKFLLEGDTSKQAFATPQSPSLEALVGASLANPSAESLKGKRDARLHPTNILQATKESIIAKVKPNFLVVSSQYIRNNELNDYVRQQINNAGGQFSDNNYATVLDRCTKAANVIDWEFYADTQGHLQFKPPTYNRTLLHHLIDFNNIDPLYASSIRNMLTKYGATESLKAVPLAKYKQVFSSLKGEMKDWVKSQLMGFGAIRLRRDASDLFSLQNLVPSVGALLGLGSADHTTLLPLVIEKYFKDGRMQEITSFIQAPAEAAVVIKDKSNPVKTQVGNSLDAAKISTSVEAISKGEAPPENYQLTLSGNGAASTAAVDKAKVALSDVLGDFSQLIATYVQGTGSATDAENNALAKAAADVIESAITLAILADQNLAKIRSVTASISNQIDAVLRAMISPDKIHSVPSAIILSEDWEESEPEFTRLNLMTAQSYAGPELQEGVAGSNINWAGSVDYDLWRIYGYKVKNQNVPFLTKGSQAAVYGDLLMARQYAKILKGSITVRGDSKYQLGDCVYIEDENIYYYITAITHQFSYGQGFSTSLTLEYGRRPGYYIPYPFDVLGKETTRGANSIYRGPAGDKETSEVDLNNLLDIAWQKDKKLREDSGYNN